MFYDVHMFYDLHELRFRFCVISPSCISSHSGRFWLVGNFRPMATGKRANVGSQAVPTWARKQYQRALGRVTGAPDSVSADEGEENFDSSGGHGCASTLLTEAPLLATEAPPSATSPGTASEARMPSTATSSTPAVEKLTEKYSSADWDENNIDANGSNAALLLGPTTR